MSIVDIKHFHLFCGLGGGAAGFNQGEARIGQMQASFKCLGGIDSDSAAIADFQRLTGTKGTVMDLFDRQQYIDWYGHEPPEEWREATPSDIRKASGNQRPHIVFTSAPCKGFSGLLSHNKSKTLKYQALNRLTLRGVWLTLEAWADDPPELILFENVPRIATRGRDLIDQITALLESYGYTVAETTHDCGELGGLAQSRRRFLLVARHQEKVPPFLYEPTKRPLMAVGDVLGRFPVPDDMSAGPMHRIPNLQWRTWLRLALVEAGKDWRSLEQLNIVDGVLADYGIVPESRYHNGMLGVHRWIDTASTVTGRGRPNNGAFAVADPRGIAFKGKYRITHWDSHTGTVISGSTTGQGAFSVADPRFPGKHEYGQYGVRRWNEPTGVVSGQSAPGGGRYSIADPRIGFAKNGERPHYQTGGHYGVVRWNSHAYAVPGKAKHDRGPWSVADPRVQDCDCTDMPEPTDQGAFIIRALDNTWHRPFTTLELAALQGLVDPDEHMELSGKSDSAWRERIGNAVPAPTAAAIASVMARTLLLAWSGETFVLDAMPVWVKPMAVAVAVDTNSQKAGLLK